MDNFHPSAKLKGPLDLPTMRQSEYDTFRYGYTYAMKSLLRNYGSQLSPSMRDVISTLATGHLANRPLKPTTWKPPNWYDVEDDLYERCQNAENLVPLGHLNGDFLELRLRGYALFQGEGERDLHGFCTLTIKNNEVMQKIECQTLGTVSGTGTAALLDDDSNVWLYNGKYTVDKCLPNFPEQVAVIALRRGETGSVGKDLILDDFYDAVVEVKDDEDSKTKQDS